MKVKNNTVILVVLFILASLSSALVADTLEEIRNFEDKAFKKQCQHIVYGSGENNLFISGVMYGVIDGIKAMHEEDEVSDFILKSKRSIVRYKVCQNALNYVTEKGFKTDFTIHAIGIIDKKHEKQYQEKFNLH